jgi:nitroimidazol reductase NimA-like FMN-containing flavoprotein (pyridoxamine 5'-phosphate oxidase superfamily)
MARSILDANAYMTLATADGDGRPWATPVYFAHLGYRDFYWISTPRVTHSRNVAVRPEVGIVVFDSQIAVGSGQAVYMEATARQLTEAETEAGLAFDPGPNARGARDFAIDQLREPAPHRLYRATVSRHWVLCRGPEACVHGQPRDHRIEVSL